MLRAQRPILEDQLHGLAGRKRELERQIADTEARLGAEKQRYDAFAEHWRSVGPVAVLGEAGARSARRRLGKTFLRWFAVGLSLPTGWGLITWMLG